VDEAEALASLIGSMGMSAHEYRAYAAGPGKAEYEAAQQQAAADHIFGVPICVFRGEPFWGNDRVPMLEQRLQGAGLALADAPRTAATAA
jgi:2-hydroxychromene-2-carboxylate isomerase